jgi:hypothetical protein
MSFRLNAIIAAIATVAALTVIREAQAIVFSYYDIADTGAGSFLDGQLFGTPVIVEGSSDVAFSGQSIQRATGIFIGSGSGATLLNQDPAGQPTLQVLEVNASLNALAVDFGDSLYEASLIALSHARTSFPNYLDRGVNAAIDNSNNVVYVKTGQNGASIVGVAPHSDPVTIVSPDSDPLHTFVPTYGLIGPKIAEKGNQVFGPSVIYSDNFLPGLFSFSETSTVDNPLTTPANLKRFGFQIGDLTTAPPATTYLTDISGSGQLVTRTFKPNDFIMGHDSPNGTILVTSAQDWVPLTTPDLATVLPSKTEFMQFISNTDRSPIAPAIAIAKNSTAFAFSVGSSIYEGYVHGPTAKKVVTIGDTIGGKKVTGIQLAEKNFVSDEGYVTFRAGFADGTSAIFEASPTTGTLPFSALESSANCYSCVLTAPSNDEQGFGTDDAQPLYISINPRGPVTVTAPDGGLFTSLMLADVTTDDHDQNPKSFMLHLGAFSTKIVANEPVLFKPLELGGDFDPFLLFNGFGTQSFVLDHFVGFPDGTVTLGLTFDTSPQGRDVLVQNVPEPTCLLLASIAWLGTWRRGRRI